MMRVFGVFFLVVLSIFLFVPVIEIKQEPQSPGLVNSYTGTHQKQVTCLKKVIVCCVGLGIASNYFWINVCAMDAQI